LPTRVHEERHITSSNFEVEIGRVTLAMSELHFKVRRE